MKKLKFNWRKWLDDFVLAGKGILLATKEKRFWYGFVPAFLFFGTLMNMLEDGTAKFSLMWSLGFPGGLRIVGEEMGKIFDATNSERGFEKFISVFLLALIQGILIGLVVLLWKKKRSTTKNNSNSANAEKAGIVTGLIVLGAGCPTCGPTLLMPLIGAIFSTGSMAIAAAVSYVVTGLAVLIALWSLKRIGLETYAIIVNERYLAKKGSR